MQLATTLNQKFTLKHPLMNAAGCCKTLEQVERFAESDVSAVLIGSITVEPREGNQGDTYWKHPQGLYSLNSMGLPNPGLKYYEQHLPTMAAAAHAQDKPLIVSVAGFSPQEYRDLALTCLKHGADIVELDIGCPSVWEDGTQKGIPSFYPDQIDGILHTVAADGAVEPHQLGVKLSPLSDPELLPKVAVKIDGRVGYVATSNTFPNGIEPDADGRSVISVEYGGMSGAALKPIALGQVRQLHRLLEQTEIVGVGGVTSAKDIQAYLDAGAVAVQAATVYWNAGQDPAAFAAILKD